MHAGDEEASETAAAADDPEKPRIDSPPRRWAGWFAVGLGLCVTVVNIALLVRIWRFLFSRTAAGSLLFSLTFASLILGIFLMTYGIVLLWSRTAATQGVSFLSMVTSMVVAAGAFAFTMWAASVVEPDKPATQPAKACADLYQQAAQIHQATALFRFPASDPDQRRCDINGFLKLLPR
jgi:hypothetical protein